MIQSSNTLRPVGTRGWLVDLPDLETVMTWHASLSATPLPGQSEVIAAARTVLVLFATRRSTLAARTQLESYAPASLDSAENRHVTIDVIYDGEDLPNVAELLGISTEDVISRHTQQRWTAAFGGFAPGFTYCVPEIGGSSENSFEWDIPRLDTPRTAVPSGAVGLAGNFSAIYPRTSPGGWQLIGHSENPMWDTHAEPPALLQPGDTVSYRAVRDSVEVTDSAAAGEADVEKKDENKPATKTETVPARPVFTVNNAGMQSLFQDAGRNGYGDMGVNHSGAADRTSAWTANDVIGNASSAAVIENIGGLSLTATVDTVICVTGAEATVTTGSESAQEVTHQMAAPVLVRAGETLKVQPSAEANTGLRHYVAARGGFIAERVLDSASTDILSGLGPRPLERGDSLKVGLRSASASVGIATTNPLRATGELRCIPGPRDDWFSAEELQRFCSMDWIVSGQSNRVGLRLALPEGGEAGVDKKNSALQRSNDGELASEGMVSGCIQVPPSGLPVVFLSDHPVTGGYPVIATVIDSDMDIAAQLSPGETVRFNAIDPDTLEPLFPAANAATEN